MLDSWGGAPRGSVLVLLGGFHAPLRVATPVETPDLLTEPASRRPFTHTAEAGTNAGSQAGLPTPPRNSRLYSPRRTEIVGRNQESTDSSWRWADLALPNRI